MRLERILMLAAVLIVAAAPTGCGGDTGGSTEPGGSILKAVTISESEFELTPSNVTLKKPATYEFRAVNRGSVTHALEIEGNGVETKSDDVAPGKSTTFKVTFEGAGSYELYCPIDGHRDRGMDGKVTIGSAAAGSGSTTSQETTPGETAATSETGDDSGSTANAPGP